MKLKKYKQVVAGRGAGERRHLPRFHLCGFVPHTHHNTLPRRYHHRHRHCHRHRLTSRQCFLHHHWHYYCHVTNFEKVNNMVMRKPADFSMSWQPFHSEVYFSKCFILSFKTTSGAGLSLLLQVEQSSPIARKSFADHRW